MNITVQVDEVTLSTAVGEILAFDSDGEEYPTGKNRTVADIVADQIVTRLTQDKSWPSLRERMLEIRSEVIREALRPQIDEAIAKPIQKTNHYGEPAGEPTTLRELIVDEARKAVNAPADKWSSNKGTYLQQAVAAEVQKALKAEIADAVKRAREEVAAQIGEQVAAAVQAGLKAR